MKGKFIHVYIDPNPGVTMTQIEAKMNLALDWFRYSDNVWVVYSTADLSKWKSRLQPLASKGGHYFVCEIDPNKRVGNMAKAFWDWLRKERE